MKRYLSKKCAKRVPSIEYITEKKALSKLKNIFIYKNIDTCNYKVIDIKYATKPTV